MAAKSNPNLFDSNNATALSWAALRGHLGICKALVQGGATVNTLDKDLNSPFSWSCGNGHVDVAEYLLSVGANPNTVDKHRNAPLHWTCQNGHMKVVKFLLSIKGVNINQMNIYNYTPLDYAIDRKNMDVVQLLKRSGAKSGTKVTNGVHPKQKRDFIIRK